MDLWNFGVRRVGTSKRSRMSLSDPSHYVEKKKLKRQKIKTKEKDAHCTALLSLSNIKCARTGTRLASIVTSHTHTHTGFYTAHPNPSQTIHSITSSHFLLKKKNSKKQNYVLEIKKTKNNCEFRRGDDAREWQLSKSSYIELFCCCNILYRVKLLAVTSSNAIASPCRTVGWAKREFERTGEITSFTHQSENHGETVPWVLRASTVF